MPPHPMSAEAELLRREAELPERWQWSLAAPVLLATSLSLWAVIILAVRLI